MIRVHSFDRKAGVRPSMDGTGRHCQNFSFSSFPRQAGATKPCLLHYALNSDDRRATFRL